MNKYINLLLGFFGLITKSELNRQIEQQRLNHEEWALKHLTAKDGSVTPDCLLYIPYTGDRLTIIRSRIEVCNGSIESINVAPWCQDVVLRCIRLPDNH